MAKCPNCGAPMEGNVCTYCQYTAPNNNFQYQNSYQRGRQNTQRNQQQQFQQQNVQGYQQPNVQGNYKQKNRIYVTPTSPKSKIAALLLCIFFGYFGAHKFYVGKTGMGILYLLTFGLFGIGWIVDIILILCGSFKDSNGLPLKK